jgi:dienelactone hydrolase
MKAALLVLCLSGALLGGCAGASTVSGTGEQQIPMTVSRPDGAGPFPAVVIMHDCSGLGPASSGAPGRWARELVRRGYVVVLPDSFTPRGVPDGVCITAPPRGTDVGHVRRARDVYDALAHLRTLPYVDGRRVGVMGGSHGGSTTLATMGADMASAAGEGRAGFAAAVALYPRCSIVPASYRPVAPLLILIGGSDDWTPAEDCQKLTDAAQKAGAPLAIKVYPGTHHSFDSDRPVRFVATRINPSSPSGRGATTGGHREAWADSLREVVAFFGQHLR